MSEVDAFHRRFYDGELEQRARRSLGAERERQAEEFVVHCRAGHLARVLEVGAGGGQDGRVIAGAGLEYTGVDLSPVGARICRDLGLRAAAASALALPFADDTFDAAWTMSTLMHLSGDGMGRALAELGRVVRPGGVVEVGVWGKDVDSDRVGADGRYFRHRTDDDLRRLLGGIGQVDAFATWDHLDDDGAHYQWARIVIPG